MNLRSYGFLLSGRAVFLGLILPILGYTCVAVVSEMQWGRRGLLISWLICPLLTLAIVVFGGHWFDEPALRSPDGQTLAVACGVTFGFLLFAFGGSALALRGLGAASHHPQAVVVRLLAAVLAAIAGIVVALLIGIGIVVVM